MKRAGPTNFPTEMHRAEALGERLRLARLRRKFTLEMVSKRAGISRTTLYKIERGDPAVTLNAYLRVLAVLGLSADLDQVALDDVLGRRLQDLAMSPEKVRK